jgi:hypothetical protein
MRTTSKIAVSRLLTRVVLVLLVLGGGNAGRGELVTPARKDVVKSERTLEAARGWVSVTAEHLSATQSLRMARFGVLNACQAAYDAVERVRKEAEKAEVVARGDAAELEQVARLATQAVEPSRSQMERARDRFLDRPVVAYDIAQHGTLTFNALTGSFDLRLDDGPGITLSAGDFDALLAGRYTVCDVDPLQMASASAGTRGRLSSNYLEVQANLAAEHGPANVYLISRRFLDWATPERLSGDFAKASLATGGSVVAELAEARRQIQLEYEDLAAWLRLKGVNDLGPDPSGILVELIRTGSCPRLGLSVKTRQVDYTDRLETAGETDIPADYLKRLRPKGLSSERPARGAAERRPALAIVWNGPAPNQQSLASQLEGGFRLRAPVINDLLKRLPPQTDPRIRRILGATAQHGLLEIDASAKSRRTARAAIGLRKEDLSAAGSSNRLIVDLRPSDLDEIMSSFLSQLALGNRKSCDLDVLELDQSNGRLEVEFTLRHRHTWPRLREAQTQLRAALGPIGTDVEDLADLLPDSTFDAARKLYHKLDLQAHEANTRAYQADQRTQDAVDRVATKGHELATLAGELARAQSDLRTATEREALARQEAQAACAQMLELDAQVRLARNRANGPEPHSPANPLMFGSRNASKKW